MSPRLFVIVGLVGVVVGCERPGVMAQNALLGAEPASVDFGILSPGESARRSVALVNRGSAAVTISRLAVRDVVGFSVVSAPTRVEAGGSSVLELAFTAPAAEGVASTVVFVESDASNAPTLEIPITARTLAQTTRTDAGQVIDAGVDAGVVIDAGVDAGVVIDAGVDAVVVIDEIGRAHV
jgi:hypothetical protein